MNWNFCGFSLCRLAQAALSEKAKLTKTFIHHLIPAAAAALYMEAMVAAAAPPQGSGLLQLTGAAGGHPAELRLLGQTNQIYDIETSTNLVDWKIIAQRAGNSTTATVAAPTAPSPGRYYRAVLQSGGTQANNLATMGLDNFAPDRILVKPLPGANLANLNLTLSVQVLNVFPAFNNLHVIKVPTGKTAATLIAQYQQSGLVAYAEPDFYVHALATPNDYYFTNGALWGLHNYGQIGGKTNADIDAVDAWNIQHDATNIIVAVIDTGVRYTHEDLASNMWVNAADGSHGTNAVSSNTDPNDDYGHGTHVAGTIGAVGNNTTGVVGVAWHVNLMACKFLDASGNGTISGAIACMDYAQSHGAKIINASWGASSFTSQALHDAIAGLGNAGILFVAASGNSGANNDVTPVYPASYSDLPNIISVAATDPSDSLASFSDYGPTNVDIGAPGTSIMSCWNSSDSDYEYDDGTSMAAAMVSGAAAVLEAHFPNESYLQIKQQILANVDLQPTLTGKCVSGGRLNLFKALTGSTSAPPVTASFTANPSSGLAPLAVQFSDRSTGPVIAWNWNFGDGATSTMQNPSHTYTNAGSFSAQLTVTGGSGQTNSVSGTITVTNTPPVTASFTANPSSGQAPLTVQFTDQSTGPVTAWNWNFGDGATSTSQNPSHTYTSAGSFSAQLTVAGSSGQTSSVNHAITVTNIPPVVAIFTANPNSGQVPLTVQFTNQSTGPIISWNWNFGDGATSTSQNPSHTYTSAGSFSAQLTVAGSSGQTNSVSHAITVTNIPPVTASFAANPSSGLAPLAVQFTDQSTGPVTVWNWNFGDGATSTSQNPSHTYSSAGSFSAQLTVTGSSGQTSSVSHAITVTNIPPVTANFTANPSSGLAPLTVQFTDQSTGPVTVWNWNFGDGSTSTSQNPSHTYSSAGSFSARLTVTGGSGQTNSVSRTITVTNIPPVTASFTANPGSGQAPLTVQFTDQSTGPVTAWNWNFGDGATSTSQNPSHTYTSAGSFSAQLTVTGSSGQTSSVNHAITVTNIPPVTANFTANPSSGLAPLTVQFTDQSTGPVTAWNWNFGDGSTSTSQNPSHTYTSAGSFSAQLTVTGSSGQTSSVNHAITVTNIPPVTASFTANPSSGQAPLAVQFTNQSTGPVTAWNWNFGDGATSAVQNPTHTYYSPGNFTATLTVTGSSGQTDTTSRTISATNGPAPATVTVVAAQALATSLTPGIFELTRTGDTSSQLTVNYSLSGTAQNGVDYQNLSGSVVFPAGSPRTPVVVQPLGLLNVLKTVVLTVSPNSSYTTGTPGSATVTIVASLQL